MRVWAVFLDDNDNYDQTILTKIVANYEVLFKGFDSNTRLRQTGGGVLIENRRVYKNQYGEKEVWSKIGHLEEFEVEGKSYKQRMCGCEKR